MSNQKILFAVVAIKPDELAKYNRYFRKSHEEYAKKNGYEFKVIVDYIDADNARPQAIPLNVALIASVSGWDKYDYIAVVDPSVLIHPQSPPIHMEMTANSDKIGIVSQSVGSAAEQFYQMYDLSIKTEHVLNIDVFILNPRIHGPILDAAYTKHVDNCFYHPRQIHYAQATIGYEIQRANSYHLLSNKWNASVQDLHMPNQYIMDFYMTNYFVNFKHMPMDAINTILPANR